VFYFKRFLHCYFRFVIIQLHSRVLINNYGPLFKISDPTGPDPRIDPAREAKG